MKRCNLGLLHPKRTYKIILKNENMGGIIDKKTVLAAACTRLNHHSPCGLGDRPSCNFLVYTLVIGVSFEVAW